MSESLPPWLSCCTLTFQAKPRLVGDYPPDHAKRLSTEAFPDSGPVSLAATPNYGGLKLIGLPGDHLAISHFCNRGAKDSHGRAVASATVLIIQRAVIRRGLRNLPALSQALAANIDSSFPSPSLVNQLCELEHTPLGITTQLSDLFSQYHLDQDLVITALACKLAFGKLLLGGTDPIQARRVMDILYLLLPSQELTRHRWCTYVQSVAHPHEHLVIFPRAIVLPKRTWFDKVLSLVDKQSAPDPQLDCMSGALAGVDTRHKKFRTLRSKIGALISQHDQSKCSFDEQLESIREALRRL